jgi:hypothetical protein
VLTCIEVDDMHLLAINVNPPKLVIPPQGTLPQLAARVEKESGLIHFHIADVYFDLFNRIA